MNLCNIHEIKSLLERHGFRFSKSLGQNFLTAEWVPERIAEMCGVDGESCVLEVGPGIGCLTQELAKRGKKVVSVEIDKSLLPILKETLAQQDNVEIISGDILKTDIPALCREKFGEPGTAKVYACANLPYYITSEAISALMESQVFDGITVMVQKEVAQRICASSGTSAYSAFSIYVNFYTEPEILFDVPAGCFIPQPKVNSAVIRLNRRTEPVADIQDTKLFFALVRGAFNQRRKTLANGLCSVLGSRMSKQEITQQIEACGFPGNIRGERLSIADFAKLANAFTEK
jgi:16S rRNA (adenine1518-N6/adenine1519-N6)-dimethyltransferase